MRRRFFQRFQHGVECVVRQHVHFVDHIDLEARIHRRIHRTLQQCGHFIDAAITRRIHFHIVDKAPLVDLPARAAYTTRCRGHAGFAIERLGEDARERRLADAAGSGEQIGVVQTPAVQRVRERAHHVLLSDERSEILRSPFACENLIGHREIVSVTIARKADSTTYGYAPSPH